MIRELTSRIKVWHVAAVVIAVITIVAMVSWAAGR
jgi:hypothetical protein